jgi:hypothetical protein
MTPDGDAGGRARTALVTRGTGGMGWVIAAKTTSTTSTSALAGSRLTYLRHEWNCCTTTWGTRRPIPHDTASNDIVATHSVVRVASLRATAAALARHGTPLTGDDLMMLHGGICAVLVAGPDGHRFLVEERAAPATYAAPGPAQARE